MKSDTSTKDVQMSTWDYLSSQPRELLSPSQAIDNVLPFGLNQGWVICFVICP
jgi:hypothetical protein